MDGQTASLMARPGDVLLFHRASSLKNFRRDPWGTFCTAMIHFVTRSRWNHAALAVENHDMIEATSKGVVQDGISSTGDEVYVISVRYRSEDDRNTALAWAHARRGERYGYLNAVMCGLNNVLAGLHIAIKSTDTIICSELVAESLTHAGFDFKEDCSQVSPGDLATFFKVGR